MTRLRTWAAGFIRLLLRHGPKVLRWTRLLNVVSNAPTSVDPRQSLGLLEAFLPTDEALEVLMNPTATPVEMLLLLNSEPFATDFFAQRATKAVVRRDASACKPLVLAWLLAGDIRP